LPVLDAPRRVSRGRPQLGETLTGVEGPGQCWLGERRYMAHTIRDKEKLLNRVRRVRGQIEAVERALEAEKGCGAVLQLVVAVRGAMNSLMAELIEGHIRTHVVDPSRERDRARAQGAEELIEVIQAYLK